MFLWSHTAADNDDEDTSGGINWPEGMSPSEINDSARAMMARLAKWRDDVSGGLVLAGGTTAYTLTTNHGLSALADGQMLAFEVNATNTGAVTLNVDGIGAKSVYVLDGEELQAGDLVAGAKHRVCYDASANGSAGAFVLTSHLTTSARTNVVNLFEATQTLTFGAALSDGDISGGALTLASDGNAFSFSGTATVASMSSLGAGTEIEFHHTSSRTFTHSTDLACPGGDDLVVASGDVTRWREYASGDWRLVSIENAPMTQAQAETGTDTVPRKVAAEQLDQAIDAATAWTYEAEQSTASSTFSFTGIQSGASEIVVFFDSLSFNTGSSPFLLQIGDAGGIETSGYQSASDSSDSALNVNSTAGFIWFHSSNAALGYSGAVTLKRVSSDGTKWIAEILIAIDGTVALAGGGLKELSGELTQLQLTTVAGTATRDAGSIGVKHRK